MDFYNYVISNNLGEVLLDKSFKDITTINCGGQIRFLYYPFDVKGLCRVFKYINELKIKYFVVGNGSNILASDSFYDGVVIILKKMKYSFRIEGNILECSGFYPTIKLAYDLGDLEYGDLSFLCGIPGLLGGAIYNNSGAYNKCISDDLIDVKYIDKDGLIKTISKKNLNFSYRYSDFHKLDVIIISARFKVFFLNSSDLISYRNNLRRQIQPLEWKNMGSIFKNKVDIKAWEIIEKLNLKGLKKGDAMISKKHGNFIINLGEAKTNDILFLINLIKEKALKELEIQLDLEIKII